MGHATVGYLFYDNPENGGKAFLIGLHRCQNFKVVQRTINETKRDPITGKITRKGNPVKNKVGDMVLVDCNVKGSDNGTPSDPKFALRTLWEHVILPAYDSLTAKGGPAEGATIVHQEDNAPPHQEGDFHQWLTAEFTRRGWRLELQAPQGPYTNVLDLQVSDPYPYPSRLIYYYVFLILTLQCRFFQQCPSTTRIFYRCSITLWPDTIEFGTWPKTCGKA